MNEQNAFNTDEWLPIKTITYHFDNDGNITSIDAPEGISQETIDQNKDMALKYWEPGRDTVVVPFAEGITLAPADPA